MNQRIQNFAKPLYVSRTFLDTAVQNQLAYFPLGFNFSKFHPVISLYPKNKWAEKGIIKKYYSINKQFT